MNDILQALQRNRSLFEQQKTSAPPPADTEQPPVRPPFQQALSLSAKTHADKPILPAPPPEPARTAWSLAYPSVSAAESSAVSDLTAGRAVSFPGVQPSLSADRPDPVESLMHHLETASRLGSQLAEEEGDAR